MILIVTELIAVYSVINLQGSIPAVQMEKRSVKRGEKEKTVISVMNSLQEITVSIVQKTTTQRKLVGYIVNQHQRDIPALIKEKNFVFKTEQDQIVNIVLLTISVKIALNFVKKQKTILVMILETRSVMFTFIQQKNVI